MKTFMEIRDLLCLYEIIRVDITVMGNQKVRPIIILKFHSTSGETTFIL